MLPVDPDFDSHRSSLERLAYRMLGSRADAEDVMNRRQFTSYRSRAIPSITHPAADCVCIAAERVETSGKR